MISKKKPRTLIGPSHKACIFAYYIEMSILRNFTSVLDHLTEPTSALDPELKEIEALLMKEGINVPSTTEHKPESNPEGVPLGAKMSDAEIANGIAVKQVSALTFCATGLAQSIRGDIANMWVRFFMKRANYGAYFIPLIRKRGWINVPPYYYPPGAPRQS